MIRPRKRLPAGENYIERRSDYFRANSVDIALIYKNYFGSATAYDHLRRAGIDVRVVERVLSGRYRKRLFDY